LFENSQTSYNCWREYLAGIEDWCYAGFKVHKTQGHRVVKHQCIGNADHGMWWDIQCRDVSVEESLICYNRRSFIYEISHGPLMMRKTLAVLGFRETRPDGNANPTCLVANSGRSRIESSIFYAEDTPELAGVLWYERDDAHAKESPLQPDLHELVNCVLVAGPKVKTVFREANVGDRQRIGWTSLAYRGEGNYFWHSGAKSPVPFAYSNINYGIEPCDFAGWCKARAEINSRWKDPEFRSPADLDFRLQPASPLANRKDLPLWRVPDNVRAEAKRHFDWLGWRME
jgi:hypothetical protein